MLRRHFGSFKRLVRYVQTRPKLSVSGDVIPVFWNAQKWAEKTALRDAIGSYSYGNLFISAKELSREISRRVDGRTHERVLFLCSNDADYVVTLWAIWMSGQIAVPLSPQHPKNVLLYYANDAKAGLLVATPKYADLMQRVSKNTNTPLHVLDDKLKLVAGTKTAQSTSDLEPPLSLSFYGNSNALILYTSGTTGSPKGVVLTHKNLVSQVNALTKAWQWSESDAILHALPLHHVHGIVNALLCPLYVGAKTVMLPKFDANSVWSHLLSKKVSVFMAVPTMYTKLIGEYDRVFGGDDRMVEYIRNTLKSKVRLMVSGSAPLPSPVFNQWLEISGHRLLERYGMTEVGMCLSNAYQSENEPGYVGLPLPGVSVRLAEKNKGQYRTLLEASNGEIALQEKSSNVIGELLVKGEGVFREYYNRPEATKSEFTEDGWFKTGDQAAYVLEKNKFKILGRIGTDIIKSGGYKISALSVETVLLGHPDVEDCAVVGVQDEEWGERVAAVLVVKEGKVVDLEGLREWGKDLLPKYQVPTLLRVVGDIPKNAMGKVNKKELVATLFSKK